MLMELILRVVIACKDSQDPDVKLTLVNLFPFHIDMLNSITAKVIGNCCRLILCPSNSCSPEMAALEGKMNQILGQEVI